MNNHFLWGQVCEIKKQRKPGQWLALRESYGNFCVDLDLTYWWGIKGRLTREGASLATKLASGYSSHKKQHKKWGVMRQQNAWFLRDYGEARQLINDFLEFLPEHIQIVSWER